MGVITMHSSLAPSQVRAGVNKITVSGMDGGCMYLPSTILPVLLVTILSGQSRGGGLALRILYKLIK